MPGSHTGAIPWSLGPQEQESFYRAPKSYLLRDGRPASGFAKKPGSNDTFCSGTIFLDSGHSGERYQQATTTASKMLIQLIYLIQLLQLVQLMLFFCTQKASTKISQHQKDSIKKSAKFTMTSQHWGRATRRHLQATFSADAVGEPGKGPHGERGSARDVVMLVVVKNGE